MTIRRQSKKVVKASIDEEAKVTAESMAMVEDAIEVKTAAFGALRP